MINLKNFVFASASLLITSCSSPHHNQNQDPTPLQVREVQTRTFEDSDTKSVMKAMINVLQDEGYIIKTAVLDLGLLTAEKNVEIENEDKGKGLLRMFRSKEVGRTKHSVLEVSANVSDYGEDTTKARLNFQKKNYNINGCIVDADQITDDIHYQVFFAKVSKGIFFQSENL